MVWGKVEHALLFARTLPGLGARRQTWECAGVCLSPMSCFALDGIGGAGVCVVTGRILGAGWGGREAPDAPTLQALQALQAVGHLRPGDQGAQGGPLQEASPPRRGRRGPQAPVRLKPARLSHNRSQLGLRLAPQACALVSSSPTGPKPAPSYAPQLAWRVLTAHRCVCVLTAHRSTCVERPPVHVG